MKLSKAARKAFSEAGKTGGAARALKLPEARRKAIAKQGAEARWAAHRLAQALPEASK